MCVYMCVYVCTHVCVMACPCVSVCARCLQVLAETMYDVVTPSAVQELERQPGEFRAHRNAAQPADLREAVVSAATELRTVSCLDTANTTVCKAYPLPARHAATALETGLERNVGHSKQDRVFGA